MTNKRLPMLLAIAALCLPSLATAATIDYIQLFTDNRAGSGFTLNAGAGLSGDPEQNASMTLEHLGEIRSIPVQTYFFDESTFLFRPTDDPPTGFGGTPGDFEGNLLTFTITDPEATPNTISVLLTPTGLMPLQMMATFTVQQIGLNPTITWSDPGGGTIDNYRIRVFDSLGDRVFDSTDLPYAAVGGADASFTFTQQPRTIGGRTVPGFIFVPGMPYTLRIESRQWLDMDDYGPGGDFIPSPAQSFYLNRSVTELDYLATPAADVDTDFEVDGLDLQSFVIAYASLDPAADLNGDGLVNGDDLAIVAGEFGRQ